jgi:hypothetical protein
MNKMFASIKRGLRQAARHRQGKRVAGLRLHVPPEVDVAGGTVPATAEI